MVICCERCGYAASKPYLLKRHLTKKTACKPLLCEIEINVLYNKYFPIKPETKHICDYCNKSFTNRHNKSRHMKQCSEQLKAMQDRITSLEKQLQTQTQPQTINTNTNTNTNTITNSFNTTNNIQINAFGKENMNYLLESPEFEKYVVNILKKKEHGFLEYVKDKYFHADHPENHTIKKPVKNDNIIISYNGNGWENNIADDISDKIIDDFEMDLNEFLNKLFNNEKIPKKYEFIYSHFKATVSYPLNFTHVWNNDDYEMEEDEIRDNVKIRKNIVKLLCVFLYENTKLAKEKNKQLVKRT